jgi:hypothetical protein
MKSLTPMKITFIKTWRRIIVYLGDGGGKYREKWSCQNRLKETLCNSV